MYDAYAYAPDRGPPRPARYDALRWAPYPPPGPDLDAARRAALRRSAKSRTTRSAREAGWRFSDYAPDAAV